MGVAHSGEGAFKFGVEWVLGEGFDGLLRGLVGLLRGWLMLGLWLRCGFVRVG
jgi:hypothetical protein